MESQKSSTGRYDALIWLLMTEYKDGLYTPSDYILSTLKPHIESSKGSSILEIHDASLYNFTIVDGFKRYWDHFTNTANRFTNSLIVLSYVSDKYLVRDYYLANLAKLYTCWDTAYINFSSAKEVSDKAFDFVVRSEDMPKGLTEVLK